MIEDIYSTKVLTEVINRIKPDPKFFLDYFPSVVTHESDTVYMDETEYSMSVMPYAHPRASAKIMEKEGYKTKMFRPAYLKSKIEIDPHDATTRMPGESLHGALSNGERERLNLLHLLKRQRDMFDRRLEVMAAEILVDGKLKVQSKDEFNYVVDFERHPEMSKALAGDDLWSSAKSDIAEQIEDFSQTILDKSGGSADTLVFGRSVWNAFRKNKSIEKLMDLRRGVSSTLEMAPNAAVNGLQEKGYFGSYRVLVHMGSYIDPFDGVTKPFIPDGHLLVLSPEVNGIRHFGAIKDRSAQMQAIPYFAKKYEVEDPSALYILAQSAPLLVPRRVNASMCIKVL
jgi:hypothetical protein